MSILTKLAGWQGYLLVAAVAAAATTIPTTLYLNKSHDAEVAKIKLAQSEKDVQILDKTLTDVKGNLDDMRAFTLRSTQASEKAATDIEKVNENLKNAPTALPVGCGPDDFRVRNLFDQIDAANGQPAATGIRLGPTLPQDSLSYGK